ncbi:11210_t:CDS:1, partial [Funneliformis mosseae]
RPETIINGWRKTGILPQNTNNDQNIDDDFANFNFTDDDEEEDINQIQDLIDRLVPNVYENPIFAKEYLQYEKDETNNQMMTDKEIIEIMKEPEEPNIEESDIPIISNYEVLVALNQIIIYTDQKSDKIDFSKDQIRAIKKLRKVVEREEFNSKQQVTLDLCFETNTNE